MPACAGTAARLATLFACHLPMPTTGPKPVVGHLGLDWESEGHPPDKVYDQPHFDFRFCLVSPAELARVEFARPENSGLPAQQPPAELMPPGTAVPKMGAHALNPAAAEFRQKPFEASFIDGDYSRRLIFVEPMVTLAFLKSRSRFSGPPARPARYARASAYPSA